VRETRRTDAERAGLMLSALRDARVIVEEGREHYVASSSDGMLLRRGLKNCVYEYCEAAQGASKGFRSSNRLPWEANDRMRFNLAHDYLVVSGEEILEFADAVMLPSERILREARFP
jgi:uncharacterized protein with HEPN domain